MEKSSEESATTTAEEGAAVQGDSSSAAAPLVQQQQPPQHQQHNVSQASYPLPEPLVQRLVSGVLVDSPADDDDNDSTTLKHSRRRIVETFEAALAELVANSIEAIDSMYFNTPAKLRPHIQHRLCLRICTNPALKTLSITDLGIGMTRSDLINSLGIGRAGLLLQERTTRKKSYGQDEEDGKETATDTTDDEEEFEYEDDDDEEETEEEEDDEEETGDDTQNEQEDEDNAMNGDLKPASTAGTDAPIIPVLSCKTADLGGFYAALCSLGTGVWVGTKSKFDAYYEFQVGNMTSTHNDSNSNNLDTFTICRPQHEGAELTVETGFDQFHHVRGESGTCVTLRLNQLAVEAGLLDEQAVLKPMILRIVSTTQHSVAFSTDTEQAQEIIQASAKEIEAVAKAMAAQQEEATLDDPLLLLEHGVAGTLADMDLANNEGVGSHNSVKERAKYIPLRLSLDERKMLRLVEAAMTCCDYTTRVDQNVVLSTPKNAATNNNNPKAAAAASATTNTRRVHEQLKNITAVLRGLVTACDYQAGQALLNDNDNNFSDYETFFRRMFEIARRHKIMNPEKMRTEYGKLIYILQDAVSPTVQPHLGFNVVGGPVHSVYKFLEERGGLALLSDKLIETATEEILSFYHRTRGQIEQAIRQKERAVSALKRKYQTTRLSADDIHLCLYSICDNNSFLNSNRVPIDKIIDYLTSHFSPDKAQEGYSLSIVSGEDGARLSHSHERQYYFALQSLTLWRDIIDDMFRLWAMAEEDLLSESITYSLQDTGQGMQRVQQSPRTYQAMQQILARVQKKKVRHWVGSSVIHMGDHNVPNALSFIDKYTQVPRILGPIVACLENLERICEKDDDIQEFINQGFGGLEKLRQDILYDFFRSAFDGSGADNFYDAGSCIDGRLTSAWNWCSQLPEKPFFPVFKLAGFIGFDGEFK